MKIPSLLAQYLYGNQRLDLPGIGTFLLDSSVLPVLQNTKQRSTILEGVSFENNPFVRESPGLIEFIAEKTGKMKPLASADLESYLELAHQFLNMGKPYAFEGIGILTKIKAGEFQFTPISIATDKIREQQKPETAAATEKEEPSAKYDSFLSIPKSFEWRKPVLGLFAVCGLAIAVWGGYMISKKNGKKPSASTGLMIADNDAPQQVNIIDTVEMNQPADPPAPDTYKYILETAKKKRALKRYNQLKEIRWKVELETQDSVDFKLYMLLPATPDTLKKIDSLSILTGRKVHIEYAR